MKTIARTGLALAMGLCSGGVTASAEDPPSGSVLNLPLEGVKTAPNWRAMPSGEDLSREFPPLAMLMRVEGRATITCQAQIDGHIDGCWVARETPAGVGFGAAALRLAAYFTMKPGTFDGKPVASAVTIPLVFKFPRGTPAPLAADAPLPPVSAASLELARKILTLQHTIVRAEEMWRRSLDQQAAALVASGEAEAGQAALDALRAGVDETTAEETDRRAHLMAAQMTQDDLHATVAFLETKGGASWIAAQPSFDESNPTRSGERLARAARAHFCAEAGCSEPEAAATTAR